MLSERANRILDLEERYPRPAASKWDHIYALAPNAARYHQELNALLDNPDAIAERPMLVKRLRRQRDARVRARANHQFRAGSSSATPLATRVEY